MDWMATDTMMGDISGPPRHSGLTGDMTALLQYTSGSTGDPKGVMVSHAALLHTIADMDRGWDHTEKSVMVTWLPVFHDLGLIYGILTPLCVGFPAYVMPPAAFLQRPVRWLRAISRHKGTHSAAPNFAYDLCVRKVTPEQRESLDLSSWKVALNAAEPVRAETIRRFNETFGPRGLAHDTVRPGYGLAEASLKVSALPRKAPLSVVGLNPDGVPEGQLGETTCPHGSGQAFVGCGHSRIGSDIRIVHPETCILRPSGIGEIWVSGPSVAQGYWNRPEETERTFQAHLSDTGEGPFLRTGDLGFLRDGELFVTGRIKDLSLRTW